MLTWLGEEVVPMMIMHPVEGYINDFYARSNLDRFNVRLNLMLGTETSEPFPYPILLEQDQRVQGEPVFATIRYEPESSELDEAVHGIMISIFTTPEDWLVNQDIYFDMLDFPKTLQYFF